MKNEDTTRENIYEVLTQRTKKGGTTKKKE